MEGSELVGATIGEPGRGVENHFPFPGRTSGKGGDVAQPPAIEIHMPTIVVAHRCFTLDPNHSTYKKQFRGDHPTFQQ